jgi:hypothetical protein
MVLDTLQNTMMFSHTFLSSLPCGALWCNKAYSQPRCDYEDLPGCAWKDFEDCLDAGFMWSGGNCEPDCPPHAVAVHRWNMQTMRYFRMLALPMTSRPMLTKALATTTPFLLPLKSVCKLSYHSSNPEETCKWFQGGRSRWLLFFKMYQLSWQGEM